VSFEFSLGVNRGKLPVTSAMSNFAIYFLAKGYHQAHRTCWRTSGKETKAYPTICNPTNYANWGLPKQESRKKEVNMRLWLWSLNILHGNGAAVVVWGRESRSHGEGRQLLCAKIKRD